MSKPKKALPWLSTYKSFDTPMVVKLPNGKLQRCYGRPEYLGRDYYVMLESTEYLSDDEFWIEKETDHGDKWALMSYKNLSKFFNTQLRGTTRLITLRRVCD